MCDAHFLFQLGSNTLPLQICHLMDNLSLDKRQFNLCSFDTRFYHITLTIQAMCMLRKGLRFFFQAERAICPFGSCRRAHFTTCGFHSEGMFSPDSSKKVMIAFSSSGEMDLAAVSIARSSLYLPPRSIEPQGGPLAQSRPGIIAVMALTLHRRSAISERLAKGFECCRISSPRFPIILSMVHWLYKQLGPTRKVSGATCTRM